MGKNAPLTDLKNALLSKAEEQYASDAVTLALCKGDVEAFVSAYAAYLKTIGNTISSYSINGRSVTKATADPSIHLAAYRRLALYFDDLPDLNTQGANGTTVNFTGLPTE